MRLVWAQYALDDRDNIFSYIETENPRAAVLVDEEIVHAARRLLDFPESGHPGRIAGTRELVIPPHTRYCSLCRDDRQDSCSACFAWRPGVARRGRGRVVFRLTAPPPFSQYSGTEFAVNVVGNRGVRVRIPPPKLTAILGCALKF